MIKFLTGISNKKLLIPLYHTVSDQPLSHIKNLYPLRSIKQFESDIDWLLKYYEPISMDQLVDLVKNRRPFKKNSFILTFDDGLKEIKDQIAPILLRKGIPAIFFINSGFVDNKDLFYRYKASVLIERLSVLNSQKLEQLKKILKIESINKEAIQSEILKINYSNKFLLDDLASEVEFSFENYLRKEKPYLSVDDLKDLQKKGFAIGAHSIDHPEYFNLSLDDQINQTVNSVNWVKEKINPRYNVFAFPFTDYQVSKAFFDKVFSDDGLKLDLSFGCAGIKDDYHSLHLQRLAIEEYNGEAAIIVRTGYIRYLLKRIIKKDRIIRR